MKRILWVLLLISCGRGGGPDDVASSERVSDLCARYCDCANAYESCQPECEMFPNLMGGGFVDCTNRQLDIIEQCLDDGAGDAGACTEQVASECGSEHRCYHDGGPE